MAGLLNDLLSNLDEQLENYEYLLGLSYEKKDTLINNDIDELQKITQLENTLVGKNTRLEKKRMSVMSDIASVMNKNENELTLIALSELVKDSPEHDQLVAVTSKIRDNLTELKSINDQNKLLIDNSLDYINFSMNLLSGAMSGKSFYTAKGEEMNENKSIFDAKQ